MGLLRQLLGCVTNELSYVFADPITRRAALIDPINDNRPGIERLLRELGLELDYVIATHRHAEEWSEGFYYRDELGARLAVHEASRFREWDLQLRDGDHLFVGEEVIEVLHTPGHTPCSISLFNHDRMWVGDTLHVGGVAAVQGFDADPRALYGSIGDRIYGMSDDTLIYPAHSVEGRRISCVAQERDINRDLPGGRSYEAFSNALHFNAASARDKKS